jgi:hypothetical protein
MPAIPLNEVLERTMVLSMEQVQEAIGEVLAY